MKPKRNILNKSASLTFLRPEDIPSATMAESNLNYILITSNCIHQLNCYHQN